MKASGFDPRRSVSVANDIKGDGGKVRLLYNEPGTNSFPPFVIKKFALDKKYGFELQPIPVSTSQATANALQAGGGDVGILDWITLARMQSARRQADRRRAVSDLGKHGDRPRRLALSRISAISKARKSASTAATISTGS